MPSKITSTLNGYVDKMVDFAGDGAKSGPNGGFSLSPGQIVSKQMQLGIPASATADQLSAIVNSIQYAQSKGIQIIVTKVKS